MGLKNCEGNPSKFGSQRHPDVRFRRRILRRGRDKRLSPRVKEGFREGDFCPCGSSILGWGSTRYFDRGREHQSRQLWSPLEQPESKFRLDLGQRCGPETMERKVRPCEGGVKLSACETWLKLDIPPTKARYVILHTDTQVTTERPVSLPVLVQPYLGPGHKPTRDVVHHEGGNLESEMEEFEWICHFHGGGTRTGRRGRKSPVSVFGGQWLAANCRVHVFAHGVRFPMILD